MTFKIKKFFTNIMLIPQKLISDEKCGVTAQQQSVPLSVFNSFKNATLARIDAAATA